VISGTHEEGTIQATHGTSANVSELIECRHFIRAIQRTDILKGYACAAHDALLTEGYHNKPNHEKSSSKPATDAIRKTIEQAHMHGPI